MKPRERYSTLEVVSVLLAVGLLVVVGMPGPADEGSGNSPAGNYIRALHGTLADHVADHYLRGIPWVECGEELMGLLGDTVTMPPSLRYRRGVWIDRDTGDLWRFRRATEDHPPRIERFQPGTRHVDRGEMEPLG